MATFLDVGLLEHFSVIFVVLVVFVIVFGLLEYIKAFGSDKKGLHAIIAFVVALLFLVSKAASTMVTFMVPWFLVLILFVFFSMFVIRMFGLGEGDMKKLIADPNVHPWIIIFIVLILVFGLASVFGQSLLESGGGELEEVEPGYDYNVSSAEFGSQPPAQTRPAEPETLSTTTSSFSTNLLNTLRHPKVLGVFFVFLVGLFAMLFLTKSVKGKG